METSSKNRHSIGMEHETEAVKFLESHGFRILERNFRSRFGEIDIVCKENEYIVFSEVKYRSTEVSGAPQEAVTYPKMRNISKTALYFLKKNGYGVDCPVRFDVIVVTPAGCEIIRDAFPYVG